MNEYLANQLTRLLEKQIAAANPVLAADDSAVIFVGHAIRLTMPQSGTGDGPRLSMLSENGEELMYWDVPALGYGESFTLSDILVAGRVIFTES